MMTPVGTVAAPMPALSLPAPPILYFQVSEIQNNTDYPAEALAAKAEGWATVRLDIDVDGKVTGCAIAESSGHPSLDDASCTGARRFVAERPALDVEGRPTTGVVERAVWWRLPSDTTVIASGTVAPPPPRPAFPFQTSGKSTVRMVIGADGKISGCEVKGEGSMAEAPPFDDMCRDAERDAGFLVFGDAEGKAVAKVFSLTFAIDVDDVPGDLPGGGEAKE